MHTPLKTITLTALATLLCLFTHAQESADTPTPAEPRTVRIAVCQTFCIDSDKEGNLTRISRAIATAAKQEADIACFPETAILGWVNPDAHELADPIPGETTNRLAALAKEHNIMIAIGLCEKEGEALYDTAVLIGSDGEILLKHRKCNVLSELMDPPYTPGKPEDVRVVETPLGRIGMLICADTFQDQLVSSLRAQSPDLILVPYGWAADRSAWPEHADSLHAWIRATATRAACTVVGTNSVGSISKGPWTGFTFGGQSALASPDGTITTTLSDRDADLQVVEIALPPKPK